MNATEVHLILNHVPVLFSITGGLILCISFIKGGMPVRNTGMGLLIIAAVATIPVFLTGEAAEETVEHLGIAESLVEEHEEIAEAALYVMVVVGVLAVSSVLAALKSKVIARYLSLATIVASFFAFGFIAQAAHLGGQIRHTEVADAAVIDGVPDQEREGGENGDDD